MNTKLRITQKMVADTIADLRRLHEFAFERVGFLFCRQSRTPAGMLLLACRYVPVRDEQYIPDETVGARFDSSSIREAMQVVLSEGLSVLHVHLHDHTGEPRFSGTDNREMKALMPCFVNVRPDRVHGALVLSADSAVAKIWSNGGAEGEPLRITVVGPRMKFLGTKR